MRILHIVEATVAGVRTHVQALVSGLDRSCFQSFVACPLQRQDAFGDNQFVSHLTQAGISVIPVPMRRAINPVVDGVTVAHLAAIMRREQFDLIHLHSSKAGILGRLAAQIVGGLAVVYSPHGLFFLGDHGRLKRRLYQGIEQVAAHWCDRIIATSPSERDTLLTYHIAAPSKVSCIEYGITIGPLPSKSERYIQRRALDIPPEALVIGTVARVVAQKNPMLFVEAAAHVSKLLPQARFVWCGDGDLRTAVENRAQQLGIAQQCHFLGHREDARALLAGFDLFWLTSDYESFGMATAEAMAAGLPVVATDIVGTCDVVVPGSTGYLVPPRDPQALAQATVRLLGAPERIQAFGEAGRARVLERFTIPRMARQTAQVYEELIASRRSETVERSASS